MNGPPVTADYMREWARHAHGSPLYAELCEVVARSGELLRIMSRIENRPPPNVLFAAVHYLLMKGQSAELARFYPSLADAPEPPAGVGGPFTDFVRAHEESIAELGSTRYTQTNECRRCTALLPAIWETGFSRFHLVDLGASAGLNLLIDRYRYRWDAVEWGPGDSPLVLETELRGEAPTPGQIEVVSRTGLDLNPIDPGNPDDRLWLEALVWPEHAGRRHRLGAALAMAAGADIEMVAGSALDTLGPVLDRLPSGDPVVVIHSFTLNQFTSEERSRVHDILDRARDDRPLARVFFEHMRGEDAWHTIGLDTGSGQTVVGQGHPHGEWVEFYARP